MTTRRTFLVQSVASAGAFTAIGRAIAASTGSKHAGAIDPALLKRAETLLEQAPLIDTHNDLPSMFPELSDGDLSRSDLSVPQPTLCADPARAACRARRRAVLVDIQ